MLVGVNVDVLVIPAVTDITGLGVVVRNSVAVLGVMICIVAVGVFETKKVGINLVGIPIMNRINKIPIVEIVVNIFRTKLICFSSWSIDFINELL